ncbi:MAG: hypothetical protein ACFWUD_01820 [Thermocaproicibacter melissae]|uniref:hypothetical protein n=1 Tax=Thermocaproicibacter melissae TaxID=2966552 RepID=UPI0024B04B09|nr:hypothetical protein [Thermocaproicibacter melissae]WBY63586.1 hypothetical protein NOG13_06325 [Thermocaproicibacter melissae]
MGTQLIVLKSKYAEARNTGADKVLLLWYFLLLLPFFTKTACVLCSAYPATPVVGIAGGAYILISTVMGDPIRSLIGIGITLVDLPIYSNMIRAKKAE